MARTKQTARKCVPDPDACSQEGDVQEGEASNSVVDSERGGSDWSDWSALPEPFAKALVGLLQPGPRNRAPGLANARRVCKSWAGLSQHARIAGNKHANFLGYRPCARWGTRWTDVRILCLPTGAASDVKQIRALPALEELWIEGDGPGGCPVDTSKLIEVLGNKPLRSLGLTYVSVPFIWDLAALSKLTGLKVLRLRDIKDPTDASPVNRTSNCIALLTGLEELELTNTNIPISVVWVGALTRLTTFRSSGMDFKSLMALADASRDLPLLSNLDLGGNRGLVASMQILYMPKDSWAGLLPMRALTSLDLADCGLNFSTSWGLAALSQLRSLRLDSNMDLCGSCLHPSVMPPSLDTLSLSGCVNLDGSVQNLLNLTTLKRLNISDCGLSPAAVTRLRHLTHPQPPQ